MKASLTVLGSGTSMGVPTIGCACAVCRSSDPHDRRTRPSILLEFGGKFVLIDTTPDFREQAIREGIRQLDAVLYTHAHADHILGLDDLRPLSFDRPEKIPLYAQPEAAELLRRMFRYIFQADYKFGGLAQVEMHLIDGPIALFGAKFEPVKVAARRCGNHRLPLWTGGLSDRFQRDSGTILCAIERLGHLVPRCAAA